MKISYNWLKTILPTPLSAEECGAKLTASGLEVESIEAIESIVGGLKGLVIGKVITCEKHPDADRLSITTVDVGTGTLLNIVCGAPNVGAGQKVVVATVGTKLFPSEGDSFEIKKSKIRGAVSEGMLCAEDEIGLGKSHAGIMVLPDDVEIGTPAADYFNVENDLVFEIGLTPNRSDAASHLGVARDLLAILKTENQNLDLDLTLHGLEDLPEGPNTSGLKIEIQNLDGCQRYSGIVISGIEVKESPDWLKNRLASIGVRSINNIVDSTNFVLHELGQPLHAFDLAKIKGDKIIVRSAHVSEKFVTLDGLERNLAATDLLICDAEKPMCLAGVFGGAESGVTENTTAIFIESAYFDPAQVRQTAKNHGLKTDASFRFERGTDPEMTITALQRCANIILQIAGGTISSTLFDLYPTPLDPYKIAFSFSNCTELIGKDIDRNLILHIIRNLGMTVEQEGHDGLLLSVPRYKTDVTREADVIEEVMRIYGYNNVEVSKSISYSTFISPRNFDLELEQRIGNLLEGFGFHEMMNLSLSSDAFYAEKSTLINVLNPLSAELNVLRQNLLFGGLETLSHNINRRNADLRFFEIGRKYSFDEEKKQYIEEKQLQLLATGNVYPQNAFGLSRESDLLYLKGICEQLLNKCGLTKLEYVETESSDFDFGLEALYNKKCIFKIGSVAKSILKKAEIQQAVISACIEWAVLLKAFSKQKTEFTELSKFPSVRRDLALLIDRAVKFSEIRDLAYSTEKKYLTDVNLFDIYEGEKLGDKKSYAVSFTLLNKEATLTDKQIEGVMEKLITTYREKLGAELR